MRLRFKERLDRRNGMIIEIDKETTVRCNKHDITLDAVFDITQNSIRVRTCYMCEKEWEDWHKAIKANENPKS